VLESQVVTSCFTACGSTRPVSIMNSADSNNVNLQNFGFR
jgi:hypothetical protein